MAAFGGGGRQVCESYCAGDRFTVADRERNPKWKNPPMLIDMSICINCDTCIRHCPPHFGAIFNHGLDVVIIPELCSGCLKCVDPCPVDCIELRPAPALPLRP